MEAAPGYESSMKTDEKQVYFTVSNTDTGSHLQQLLVRQKKRKYQFICALCFCPAPERMHTLAADSRTPPVFILKVKHRDSRQTLPKYHYGEKLDLV